MLLCSIFSAAGVAERPPRTQLNQPNLHFIENARPHSVLNQDPKRHGK